jgi:hypothetical protein
VLAFLAGIGTKNRALIRDVTVREWPSGQGTSKGHIAAAFALMADCVHLRRLFFDCHFHSHDSVKGGADRLFRDGHWFFEAFGAAHGRPDAVLDVLCFSEKNWKDCWWNRNARVPHEKNVKVLRERLAGLLKSSQPQKGRKKAKSSR